MELPLSPLHPFLALPIKWSRWRESFETFIAAMELVDALDTRQMAMQIHSLGSEPGHLSRSLRPVPVYANCDLT